MPDLNGFLRDNMNKAVILLFSFYFIIAFLSVLFASNCNGTISNSCLLNKTIALNSDVYWNYNTIRHVAAHGSFPREVAEEAFGGVVMDSMWHSPFYYYLTAPLLLIADALHISDILLLIMFSILLGFLTGFIFFLIAKRISKYLKNQTFSLYALILFLFLPMNLFFTIAVNDDVLFYFFAIFSFYMYLKFAEEKTLKNAILFGVITGLALFSKMNALLLLLSIVCYSGILYLIKRYREGTLLLISFFTALIVGSYPLIRNYILFGEIFWVGCSTRHPMRIISFIQRLTRAYWGGVFGGLKGIDIFIALIAVALIIATIFGIFLYLKSKDSRLHLLMLVGLFNILISAHYICEVFYFIRTGTCMGLGLQNRYLVLLNPIIALFSSIVLIRFNKKTLYILLFILLSALFFSLDFIFAFIS